MNPRAATTIIRTCFIRKDLLLEISDNEVCHTVSLKALTLSRIQGIIFDMAVYSDNYEFQIYKIPVPRCKFAGLIK